MRHRSMRPWSTCALVLPLLWTLGCGSGIRGKYTNPEANLSIEFLDGGKAHLSLSGIGGDCTFTEEGKKVVLTCEGEATELSIGADGALTGPEGTFLSRLTKSK